MGKHRRNNRNAVIDASVELYKYRKKMSRLRSEAYDTEERCVKFVLVVMICMLVFTPLLIIYNIRGNNANSISNDVGNELVNDTNINGSNNTNNDVVKQVINDRISNTAHDLLTDFTNNVNTGISKTVSDGLNGFSVKL